MTRYCTGIIDQLRVRCLIDRELCECILVMVFRGFPSVVWLVGQKGEEGRETIENSVRKVLAQASGLGWQFACNHVTTHSAVRGGFLRNSLMTIFGNKIVCEWKLKKSTAHGEQERTFRARRLRYRGGGGPLIPLTEYSTCNKNGTAIRKSPTVQGTRMDTRIQLRCK